MRRRHKGDIEGIAQPAPPSLVGEPMNPVNSGKGGPMGNYSIVIPAVSVDRSVVYLDAGKGSSKPPLSEASSWLERSFRSSCRSTINALDSTARCQQSLAALAHSDAPPSPCTAKIHTAYNPRMPSLWTICRTTSRLESCCRCSLRPCLATYKRFCRHQI